MVPLYCKCRPYHGYTYDPGTCDLVFCGKKRSCLASRRLSAELDCFTYNRFFCYKFMRRNVCSLHSFSTSGKGIFVSFTFYIHIHYLDLEYLKDDVYGSFPFQYSVVKEHCTSSLLHLVWVHANIRIVLFGLTGSKQRFLNIIEDIIFPLFKARWEIIDFYTASLYRQHLSASIALLIYQKSRL